MTLSSDGSPPPPRPALRQTVKGAARTLATAAGRLRLRRGRGSRVVVLCYHSIHPTKDFASATPTDFARQLDWLQEHCDLIRLEDVLSTARAVPRARPSVCLTFDDGYADNFEYAFPALQRRGIPATFFVVTGLLEHEGEAVVRQQRLRRSAYADVRPMAWSHVRAMRDQGMEIGAHTHSHPNLARLTPSAAREELRRSKEVLEDRLGHRVDAMAYPFGKPRRHFGPDTVDMVAEAGYRTACAVLFRGVRPSDSPLAIPRFFVTSQDGPGGVADKVLGMCDLLGAWQEHCPLPLAKRISPEDFTPCP